MKNLLATLFVWLLAALPAGAGIHLHGQAVSGYPLAVVEAGNQAEYDYLTVKPGYTGPLIPVASYCPTNCTTGLTYTSSPAALNFTSGTHTASGVDLTGNGGFVSGASTTGNLSNALLGNPGGYLWRCDLNAGGAGVASLACNIDHFEADYTTASASIAGPFDVNGTASNGYFHNGANDYTINFLPFTITQSYFGMFGQKSVPGGHAEIAQAFVSGTYSHLMIDMLDGGPAGGGASGVTQSQSNIQDITITFSHINAFGNKTQQSTQPNGTLTTGLGTFISCKGVGHNVDINADHLAIQTSQGGPGNYVTGVAQGVLTLSGQTGNFIVGELLTSGAKTAKASNVAGTLIDVPSGTMWNGTFAPGDVIVGGSSGNSATIVTTIQGYCHVHDNGSNFDWDTGAAINLTVSYGFP